MLVNNSHFLVQTLKDRCAKTPGWIICFNLLLAKVIGWMRIHFCWYFSVARCATERKNVTWTLKNFTLGVCCNNEKWPINNLPIRCRKLLRNSKSLTNEHDTLFKRNPLLHMNYFLNIAADEDTVGTCGLGHHNWNRRAAWDNQDRKDNLSHWSCKQNTVHLLCSGF